MGEELNSILKKLSGSIKVPRDFDYKTELQRALEEKYCGTPDVSNESGSNSDERDESDPDK
jgi:hypothetical protein